MAAERTSGANHTQKHGVTFQETSTAVRTSNLAQFTQFLYFLLVRGGKAAGPWVDHPPPSSAEFKERVELYLYSTHGPTWSVLGLNLFFFLLLTFPFAQNSIRPPLNFKIFQLTLVIFRDPRPIPSKGRPNNLPSASYRYLRNQGQW